MSSNTDKLAEYVGIYRVPNQTDDYGTNPFYKVGPGAGAVAQILPAFPKNALRPKKKGASGTKR